MGSGSEAQKGIQPQKRVNMQLAVRKLLVGVVAGSTESCKSLEASVVETRLASREILIEQYCSIDDDCPPQRLLESRPDIVLVDMDNRSAAIHSLRTLHAALPGTWLLACGTSNDPEMILEAMHAGVREFLPAPVLAPALLTAFGRHLEEKQRLRLAAKESGRIYSIISAKGSAGATSVAVNVAAILSQAQDRDVSLLDLNGSLGDVANYLSLDAKSSLTETIASATVPNLLSIEAFMKKAGKISVLAGSGKLSAEPASTAVLARLMKVLETFYTDVFIDLPLNLDVELFQTVVNRSEAILVVLTPELLAVHRAHHLLNLLESWQRTDRLRLILNRNGHRKCLRPKEIADVLGYPIFWKLPNNYRAASQAICQTKPLVEMNHSDLAESYRGLAEKLTSVSFPKNPRRMRDLLLARSPRMGTRQIVTAS
jgi:Flp pilus assembly CpaE family ATPase